MPRYVSIWFPFLLTDYAVRKHPRLKQAAFVIASRQNGRMVTDSVSQLARQQGMHPGMAVADCKALFPELQVLENEPGRSKKVLNALAEWCIRYTPFVSVDFPDGLILDASGCTHLWGGESSYIETIREKLFHYGYTVNIAMADTIGAAWAIAHYGTTPAVVAKRQQKNSIGNLPAGALRLDKILLERLKKLGFIRIDSFIDIPRETLRRRFGSELLLRMGQAFGTEVETLIPIKPIEPYLERLCCLEPISTATGITIALHQLLDTLCQRMETEAIGLRSAVFTAYRIDGDIQNITIGTVYPSRNGTHLFKLFEHKIATLEPGLGFEVFILEASKTESITEEQAAIWNAANYDTKKVSELLDRVTAKMGASCISRFLPAEHYWPERSVSQASGLQEVAKIKWRSDLPRPIHLLATPEVIEVSAVLPDYPPLLFRYKGKLYTVAKSDGPERIEQEWWISDGLYRDYYCVEDKHGARYWVFRSGPYEHEMPKWFIHGFFA
ncbi:Y-family DNA polymerase [Flavobacterium sp.]